MSLVTSAFAPPVRLSCRERRKTEGVFSHLTPDVRLPSTFFGFTPVLLSAFCSNLNFDCKAKWRERDNFLCIKAFFTQQPLVERWNLERGSFNCFLRKTGPSLLSPMWPCLSNPPSVKGALYFCLLCHSWRHLDSCVCILYHILGYFAVSPLAWKFLDSLEEIFIMYARQPTDRHFVVLLTSMTHLTGDTRKTRVPQLIYRNFGTCRDGETLLN